MEDIRKKLEERFGKDRVDGWVKQFAPRQLSVIEVEDKIAVLRPIKANELSQYGNIAGNESLDKAARYLLAELWLAGDDAILEEEEYFMTAMLQVQNTIELKKSTFAKL